MKAKAWRRTYCMNNECSKHENCQRFSEVPRTDGDNRRFEEHFAGRECSKYRPITSDGPQDMPATPVGFHSSIPQEMELREHLVRHISENLDKVFDGDSVWQQATHNYSQISARLVDLLMPAILAKRSVRPPKYR